jgi:inosine-uridine nucleoside N-ribohydrolase
MFKFALAVVITASISLSAIGKPPVKIIFDTDMGNDVDDALALAVIHALADRNECELLAVTVTKDHAECAAFIDLVNTFFNRPDTPIGVVKDGMAPARSKFTVLASQTDGDRQRYPHDLISGKNAPEAVVLLRKTLAAQPDHSVVIVQVGFSTNLSRLMDSKPDDHCKLTGIQLINKKVHHLEVMAGSFKKIGAAKRFLEYNVRIDISNAKKLIEDWPSPVIMSGFEIGISLPYPARSILNDFNYVKHHPISAAYQLYMPTPHERPTWDLTSVLHGVRPDRNYFGLSPRGRIKVHADGYTEFIATESGNRQFLTMTAEQRAMTLETLVNLSSQPPTK